MPCASSSTWWNSSQNFNVTTPHKKSRNSPPKPKRSSSMKSPSVSTRSSKTPSETTLSSSATNSLEKTSAPESLKWLPKGSLNSLFKSTARVWSTSVSAATGSRRKASTGWNRLWPLKPSSNCSETRTGTRFCWRSWNDTKLSQCGTRSTTSCWWANQPSSTMTDGVWLWVLGVGSWAQSTRRFRRLWRSHHPTSTTRRASTTSDLGAVRQLMKAEPHYIWFLHLFTLSTLWIVELN